MTAVLDVLKALELDPARRKALGLPDDWQRRLPVEFLEKVAETIKRNAEALNELKKY